jgi:hypothetical protein
LALLLLPLVFLEAQISVVSQSADEVVLEFNLPEYKIGRQNLNGVTWDRIETDAGNVHAVNGFPELRVFGEAIAIPIDGDISLQVLNVKNSILKNVNLKPTLKMTVMNESPGSGCQSLPERATLPCQHCQLWGKRFCGRPQIRPPADIPFPIPGCDQRIGGEQQFHHQGSDIREQVVLPKLATMRKSDRSGG